MWRHVGWGRYFSWLTTARPRQIAWSLGGSNAGSLQNPSDPFGHLDLSWNSNRFWASSTQQTRSWQSLLIVSDPCGKAEEKIKQIVMQAVSLSCKNESLERDATQGRWGRQPQREAANLSREGSALLAESPLDLMGGIMILGQSPISSHHIRVAYEVAGARYGWLGTGLNSTIPRYMNKIKNKLAKMSHLTPDFIASFADQGGLIGADWGDKHHHAPSHCLAGWREVEEQLGTFELAFPLLKKPILICLCLELFEQPMVARLQQFVVKMKDQAPKGSRIVLAGMLYDHFENLLMTMPSWVDHYFMTRHWLGTSLHMEREKVSQYKSEVFSLSMLQSLWDRKLTLSELKRDEGYWVTNSGTLSPKLRWLRTSEQKEKRGYEFGEHLIDAFKLMCEQERRLLDQYSQRSPLFGGRTQKEGSNQVKRL